MAQMKAHKVLALPDNFAPNDIYYLAKAPGIVEIYVANSTGTSARKVDQTQEILAQFMSTSATAPDLIETDYLLWWNSTKGTLYVRFVNPDGQAQWVEAAPATDFPAFAGNGTANTMSHSDHWHDNIHIEAEW